MSDRPHPIPMIIHCPCGAPSTYALGAVFQLAGKNCTVSIPVCEDHTSGLQLLRVETQPMPTHEPFAMQKTEHFPPSRGEVFVPTLVVGCPACGRMSGLDRDVFSVTETGITPSFICACGYHGWLTWAPT